MRTTKRILVFDSDEEERGLIRQFLQGKDLEVVDTGDGREAIERAAQEPFYLAVVELRKGDLDGLEICTRVKSASPFVPVLFLSSSVAASGFFAQYLGNADGHLHQPVDLRELELHVDALVRARVSFERLLEQQAERPLLLVTDRLTGLYNRQFLSSRLEEEMLRATRYEYPLSLMVIDLDDFKEINYHHGFLAGDAVLRQVAELLRGSLRQVDTVCRYGGEEFVALLPHTDCAGAVIAAERLRRVVQRTDILLPAGDRADQPQQTIHLTVSVGVATHPDSETTPDGLISLADQAVGVAKKQGKNCVILGGH
ncbi:MAG: diguanylate cyclase [Bradymonadales bacterium]|nr:diguanylate cyclase [Bradymonadales bacterium]